MTRMPTRDGFGRRRPAVLGASMAVLLAALGSACIGGQPSPTPTEPAPNGSDSVAPRPTVAASCVDGVEFVGHASHPDGATVSAGAEFTKKWRLRNTGTCTWDSSYSWAFAGGDVLNTVHTTPFDDVGPGQEFEVGVTLLAPEMPGPYGGQWVLLGPTGYVPVGNPVQILINVVAE